MEAESRNAALWYQSKFNLLWRVGVGVLVQFKRRVVLGCWDTLFSHSRVDNLERQAKWDERIVYSYSNDYWSCVTYRLFLFIYRKCVLVYYSNYAPLKVRFKRSLVKYMLSVFPFLISVLQGHMKAANYWLIIEIDWETGVRESRSSFLPSWGSVLLRGQQEICPWANLASSWTHWTL